MSYNVTLQCGCLVYVSCHPDTGVAHTLVIEHRSPMCLVRTHDVGVRLMASELQTDPGDHGSRALLHIAARHLPG
jgi:hypothetical protein